MWKGKQKRIRSRVLLCTNTLESWTEVLTASTWSEQTDTNIHLIYLHKSITFHNKDKVIQATAMKNSLILAQHNFVLQSEILTNF